VRLSGGTPAGEAKALALKPDTAAASLEVLDRLRALIDRFENEDQAYLSSTAPRTGIRFPGDYDHLARIKEWSKSGGEPDEEIPS
jgi:ATP-dependent helicase/nuclease subunit B